MSLEFNPDADRANAKTIRLAGKDYYIAPLPFRHVLAIVALLPQVNVALASIGDGFDEEKGNLLIEVIRRGLKCLYPAVTVDDILDLPMTMAEVMAAIPIVISQGGGRKQDDLLGETAATSSLLTTGKNSSLTSPSN